MVIFNLLENDVARFPFLQPNSKTPLLITEIHVVLHLRKNLDSVYRHKTLKTAHPISHSYWGVLPLKLRFQGLYFDYINIKFIFYKFYCGRNRGCRP
jgi:hypothetical protein